MTRDLVEGVRKEKTLLKNLKMIVIVAITKRTRPKKPKKTIQRNRVHLRESLERKLIDRKKAISLNKNPKK